MLGQIQTVKEKLNSAITQLCETSWMFVKDPARNFTRNRKLPLREVIAALLCMEPVNCCVTLGAASIPLPARHLFNNDRRSTNLPFLLFLTYS